MVCFAPKIYLQRPLTFHFANLITIFDAQVNSQNLFNSYEVRNIYKHVNFFASNIQIGGPTYLECLLTFCVLSQGMVLTAQREHPVVLKMINTAIPHIFDNPNTVFVTAPAKNLLFEGVLFNCTSSDFSTKAICSELKKRAHNFHRISEDIYSFSIFGSVRINKIVLHEFPLSITKDRSLRKT